MPSANTRTGDASESTPESIANRRTFLRGAAGAGVAATSGLAGCASVIRGGSDSPTENDPLTVAVYGGVFKDVLDSALIKPFQEATGIPTKSIARDLGDAIIQLKTAVDAGKAPVDIALIATDGRIRGQDLGLWLNYSPDELSRLDNAIPELVATTDGGKIIGVGAFGWFLNLTTNINALEEPLTSWRALWDEKYKNQLGASQLPGDGYLLNIAANTFEQFDGRESLKTKEDIMRVMKKVAEIKPQVALWWTEEAQAQQALIAGDIAATQMYNDVSLVMKENGAPVRTRFPKEGAVLEFGSWNTVRTTDYADAAQQFIDYSLKPAVQEQITKNLYSAPTIKKSILDISNELYHKVYGPGPDAAIEVYVKPYIEMEQWLNQQWKQMILS